MTTDHISGINPEPKKCKHCGQPIKEVVDSVLMGMKWKHANGKYFCADPTSAEPEYEDA